MFDVRPLDYLRALGGGLAGGTIGGLALTLLQSMVPFFGILSLMFMAALGYGVGTTVAKSTRRKQGTWLGVIAAFAVPIGLSFGRAILMMAAGADLAPSLAIGFASVLGGSLWNMLGVLLAMGIAFSRAR